MVGVFFDDSSGDSIFVGMDVFKFSLFFIIINTLNISRLDFINKVLKFN